MAPRAQTQPPATHAGATRGGRRRQRHQPQGGVGPQRRRRLLPRQLPAARSRTGTSSRSSRTAFTSSEIGKTAENRPQLMAIITSPANYAKIERYKSISSQLSHAQTPTGQPLTDAQAQALAQGRQVGHLDRRRPARDAKCSARSSCSRWSTRWSRCTDDETMRFLNDVDRALHCRPIPDGMDLVSDAYMKNGGHEHAGALQPLRRPRRQPRLVHERAAGDHEHEPRDVSASGIRRSCTTTTRPGPAGAVMFAPPFRDPFNYNFHPYIPAAMDIIGALIATRCDRRKASRASSNRKGVELLDLVERRLPHGRVLPQPDRHPDRDDRQSDAADRFRSRRASRSAT